MSGHSTPSTRSLPHFGGSPFDANGVSNNPDSSLDMTGASPGGRQYFDQPIFEYHTVPELREDDHGSPHSNHHHHPSQSQSQQPPQQSQPGGQAHPERRLSGQIPIVAGALRGMRVRTGCNTCRKRHVKCDEQKPQCQNCLKGNRPCVFPSPDSLFRHSRSGSISKKGAGHHEGISPTSTAVSPNGLAGRRHRTQPSVLPLVSTSPFLTPGGADSPSQLKVPGSALISPTGAAVTQFQGLVLAPISPAPRTSISFDATRIDTQVFDRVAPDTIMGNGVNGAGGIPFSTTPREPSVPLPLSEHESALYRNFISRLCPALDIFDFDRQFMIVVPRLARKNTGLLKACLALSAKQQYRLRTARQTTPVLAPTQESNTEVEYSQYYDAALREMQNSLVNDVDGRFSSSEEFLATAVILSTFEVIDGSNQEFRRHLEGVGSIIKPQGIHESLVGLKGAAFWAWYRQDVLAAFRERRQTFITEDFWHLDTSPESMCMLREDELGNRVMFILGQIINYCAKDEIEKNEHNITERLRRAEMLEKKLEDWKRCLPDSYEPLTRMKDKDGIFEALWYSPACCGIAMQVYYFAKIMLMMHKPQPPSQDRYQHFLAAQRQYKLCTQMIIGISLADVDESYHLISLQCLYAAGLVLDGKEERKILSNLIREVQHRTGRLTYYLVDELQKLWQEGETA
ncbi:hypothetical protein TWF106_011408 [Orbilia oligospora]|uniref:Zn(2)-C6 fungal-type domain-containing protein n=1 Tax=Orbilia oligospora TaxID=2813651 RepID=A0A6G1LX61_ORBOL|nr:hypothetical protein TWF788_010306 [Orbilia oligospora]KAF3208513.1 hypothetical protein TWF106_011408 [Orbilia oligospora]KAF3237156.1 hypothetical protein TWF192_010984 [Orbilia oligospora]